MAASPQTRLAGLIAEISLDGPTLGLPIERLFDDLPNIVFFIKDRQGRYLCVNRTLTERCGAADKQALIGKRPADLFPAPLALRYQQQDERVIQTGKPLLDSLDLHLYPGGRRGWCLTNKYPILDRRTARIAGTAGISRDVETTARSAENRGFPELAAALAYLEARHPNPPTVEEVARHCRLTPHLFNQLVRRLFYLTARQLLLKVRLDEAMHLLTSTQDTITDIALATGFCDQSALTRHFRRFTGLPPGAFREQLLTS